jgi:putative membrane protein
MPFAAAELQAFANGFPVALLHALSALLIWAVTVTCYAKLSPSKDVDQIRDGNGAAAVTLGGAMVCFALPLAIAMAASPSTAEGAIWGAAISLIGLLLVRIADMALRGLPERVREGDITAAVLLSCARLAIAILLACAVAG